MKIKKIEIHAEQIEPHGYVFRATAHAVGTAVKGLAPKAEGLSANWFDITVTNHYGYVTAGHALTMLMKKCRRLAMKPDKDTKVCWLSNEGELACVIEDKERMNSIIKTLAKKHKMQAVLPYLISGEKE